MPPSTSTPVRARLHPELADHVAAMKSATPENIFAELFQNARRAGASRIIVRLIGNAAAATTIHLNDDGHGIDDPAVLLAYGENGWHASITDREDVTGLGVACLAAYGCSLTSRPAADPENNGFRLTLPPAAFTGKAKAIPERMTVPYDDLMLPPGRTGTVVSFVLPLPAVALRHALEQPARWLPLPVFVADGPEQPLTEVPRQPFADPAKVHSEEDRTADLGVHFYLLRENAPLLKNLPDLNVHGAAVHAALAHATDAWGQPWRIIADAISCKNLERTLPARKEIVETLALTELRAAAQTFMWRTLAKTDQFVPTAEQITTIRQRFGITLPEPEPQLRPWTPARARKVRSATTAKAQELRPRALVYEAAANPAAEQSLAFAISRLPENERPAIYTAAPAFEGMAWYDALPRITAVRCVADFADGLGERPVADLPKLEPDLLLNDRQAASLAVVLETRGGALEGPLHVNTDVVLTGSAASPPELAAGDQPIIRRGAEKTLDETLLVDLMTAAYFITYSDENSWEEEEDEDPEERQEEEFDHEARQVAARLLRSEEERTLEDRLRNAIARRLQPLLPDGYAATMDITISGRINIRLHPPAASKKTATTAPTPRTTRENQP